MSRLDELISELCPEGVPFYPLNACFDQFAGMGGVTNKWADEGNCQFIDYLNAYSHIAIDVHDLPYATVKKLDQNILKQGDILFTSASEIPDECAISSVIEDEIQDGIFLDDHLFGLRIKGEYKGNISPSFLKHVFRADAFRSQVKKAVRGVTRFYVSKPDFMKLVIPVPPIDVQYEIVRILDNFMKLIEELTASLAAELTFRKKQHDYYFNQILCIRDVQYKPLEDLCEIADYRGKTPRKTDNGVFLVTAKNIRQGYIDYEKSKEYIPFEQYDEVMHRGFPKIGDVLITTEAPCGYIAQVDREDIALAQRVIKYRPKTKEIDSTFLKYIMMGKEFQDKLQKAATGGTVKGIKGSKLHKLTIPVPLIDNQLRIVSNLNGIESFFSGILNSLPIEIETRRKQYEYYRDRLLSFKRC